MRIRDTARHPELEREENRIPISQRAAFESRLAMKTRSTQVALLRTRRWEDEFASPVFQSLPPLHS